MSKSSLEPQTNQILSSVSELADECELSDREYVMKGFAFWLNNKPKQSEAFFKLKSDRTTILAGYAFILCMVMYKMDLLDSFELIH